MSIPQKFHCQWHPQLHCSQTWAMLMSGDYVCSRSRVRGFCYRIGTLHNRVHHWCNEIRSCATTIFQGIGLQNIGLDFQIFIDPQLVFRYLLSHIFMLNSFYEQTLWVQGMSINRPPFQPKSHQFQSRRIFHFLREIFERNHDDHLHHNRDPSGCCASSICMALDPTDNWPTPLQAREAKGIQIPIRFWKITLFSNAALALILYHSII